MRSQSRHWSVLFASTLVLALLSCSTPARAQPIQGAAPAESQPAQPTMQQRLDRLCEQLEQQRQSLHIPGLAIAIVKDDQVILSRGFGVRDVANNLPVTSQTLFAIGSTSKAFTTALIAMLVDEGKMAWDDPVRKHVPGFRLFDKEADEQITIRDLLCHRSGLERTDLVWASGEASREEILAAIATAEPVSKFREKFHYQNVMYLTAGIAAANAAGLDGDWDALVAQRIFQPLAMNQSNTNIEAAKGNPELSLGYAWIEDKSEFRHLPMRNLNSIAPAGAINSNLIDMAQWLRLQLNKGEVDGRRLIALERFDEMRAPEIALAEGAGIDYGLGWMLQKRSGHAIVEHGGNIDGFAAQVTLLPEEKLGYVLLTNVSSTPLQQMSIGLVCDALFGDWKETAETVLDPTSVQDFLGKYRLDVLKTDVTVLMKDGKLAVDVPGQMVFTLKPPTPEGKWVFELTDTIAVSFVKDAAGSVMAMNFYQSGMTLECPKDGVVLPTEIGLDEAQKYLGKYHDEENKIDVTVIHRNGRLAIDVPGQMIFDLRLPNDEGKWVFRATDAIAVRFEQNDQGAITGLTEFQDGKERLVKRVADGDTAKVPTVDEILQLHERGCGTDGISAWGNVRITGTARMVNQGIVDIRMTILASGADRFMQHTDMGKFGWIKVGLDGTTGWTDSIFSAGEEIPSDQASLLRLQNPLLPVLDWRRTFDKIEISKAERIEEHDVVVVELAIGEKARCVAYVDRTNGHPMRLDYKVPVPGVGSINTKMALTEWREVDGVVFPHHWEIESGLYGKTVVEIEKIEARVELPADAFKMPVRTP